MVIARPLRLIFFGTPEFAVPTLRTLLDSRHQVVMVVSQPDRPRGRGQKVAPTATKLVALERGVDVRQPERVRDDAFLHEVAALSPDLGVVAAYGKLLPDALLTIPALGMINVHASLLPRWRGAAPVHRAVIAGDSETGVTIMRVVSAMDAGPMLRAARRAIGPDETSPEIEHDLAHIGGDLLLQAVEDLAGGRATEVPQDERDVTYAPKVTKAEGAIDWLQPAQHLHNLVRGLQPWPLVSVRIGGTRLLVHRSGLTDDTSAAPPGTVVRASGDDLAIAVADGRLLRLLLVQPEGRRVMSAREFLAGRPVTPGVKLERG